MMKAIFVAFSLAFLSPGSARAQAVSIPASPAPAAALPMEFGALKQDFLTKNLDFRPEEGTSLGLNSYNPRLSDLSQGRIQAHVAYLEAVEKRLAEIEPRVQAEGAQALIDHSVMLTITRSQLHDLRDLKNYQKDVAAAQGPYDSIQSQLARLQAGPSAAAEIEAILRRAEQLPAYLEQVRENLRMGIADGRRPSRQMVEKDGLANGENAAKFFASELETKARELLSPEDFARLSGRFTLAGQAAARAYDAHLGFLKNELLPVADGNSWIGEKEYAWKVKNELGIEESPYLLQSKGLELAIRIRGRMEELARSIDPSKDLNGVMADIKADHPLSDEDLFSRFEQAADRARDFVIAKGLFDLPKDYKLKIIPTPEGMRSTMGSAAYFPAPAFAPGTQGTFLVTPSAGDSGKLAVHNNSKIPTTAVHEAFPGHDLQFWSFQHGPEISPVRYLLEIAGYSMSINVEGYAHYAEELMRLYGFYTPKEELAQLAAQLWRAWRIVLDIALHTGQKTVSEVAEALAREAFIPQAQAEIEAYRYSRWPTQAITYLLGRLQIEDLKAEYKTKMGENYSEAEFHRLFLSFGPVPTSAIRPVLLGSAGRS
jgi:uncharacterized protein (DUF885 family)